MHYTCNLFNLVLQKPSKDSIDLGHQILHHQSTPEDSYWYWIGVCVLLAYAIFFNIVLTAALTYLNRKLFNLVTEKFG